MRKILITQIKEVRSDGIIVSFNQPVSLENKPKLLEWFMSWDFIGRKIFGKKYCTDSEARELREKLLKEVIN